MPTHGKLEPSPRLERVFDFPFLPPLLPRPDILISVVVELDSREKPRELKINGGDVAVTWSVIFYFLFFLFFISFFLLFFKFYLKNF